MFARLTMFAVVALALAVGGQAKAAPLIYGTYYDEEEVVSAVGGCVDETSCRTNFSQTPSNNLVLLKKVNCSITSTQPITQLAISISPTLGGQTIGRAIFVSPGPAVTTSGPNYWYSFETDAQILIGQGRYPYIVASTTTTATSAMACGILGDLVTPIQ